jgi:hypothetical protein
MQIEIYINFLSFIRQYKGLDQKAPVREVTRSVQAPFRLSMREPKEYGLLRRDGTESCDDVSVKRETTAFRGRTESASRKRPVPWSVPCSVPYVSFRPVRSSNVTTKDLLSPEMSLIF